MRTTIYLVFVCSLFYAHCVLAQTPPSVSPPKIGLTLSGGGAKGLAHIGVLRMIDSLDIQIDYISATSMGSVLGALYAMGYSGDDIKRIALTEVAWRRMLVNLPPFQEVAFEERDEFNRYALELPMKGIVPSAPNSFIEGQYILSLFNYFTYTARGIQDFSKLPIPLRMMGSDIINGGSVRLDSGSLAVAMRASMAIPVIFTPMLYQGKLLVDGGLDNNFAIDEAISMGATKVIGSYTGFRVYQKSEISSPTRFITQTYAFGSVKDANVQMKHAAVVINHTNALKRFSTTDFTRFVDIIRIGEEEARKMLPELQRIADEQHRLGIHRNRKLVREPYIPIDKIQFLDDNNEQPSPSVVRFSTARLGLDSCHIYSAADIREATKRLYGSRFFDNVYLDFDSTTLNVHLKDKEKDHLKAAIHYDTYNSVGVILNYTARQVLLPNSRLVLTADISQRLKVRANYQFYINKKYNFWLKPFFNYENTAGQEILQQYENNQKYNATHYDYGIGIGYSIKSNSGFALHIRQEHDILHRIQSAIKQFEDLPTNVYNHSGNVVQLNWTKNTFNNVYFPTRGSQTTINLSWSYQNKLNINSLALQGATDSLDFEQLVAPHKGQFVPSQLAKFLFQHQFIVPFKQRKLALVGTISWGGLWDTKSRDSLYLSNPTTLPSAERYVSLNDRLYVGGARLQNSPNRINFVGLRPGEVATYSNVTTLNIGLQYAFTRQIFLTPSLSYGFANPRGFNPLSGFGHPELQLFGFGLKVGYQSPIGPVLITGEYGNNLWRSYLAIGFPF